MRLELIHKSTITDGRSGTLRNQAERAIGQQAVCVEIIDVFLLSETFGLPNEVLKALFCDAVAQEIWLDQPVCQARAFEPTVAIEVSSKAGVTDPVAITIREALARELGVDLPPNALIQTAHQLLFWFEKPLTEVEQRRLAASLYNPLIQRAEIRNFLELKTNPFPSLYHGVFITPVHEVEYFKVATMSDEDLTGLSKTRLLALTLDEMREIRTFYANQATIQRRKAVGMRAEASDVELEMLAQTWSEHCKHKIFAATVNYIDEEHRDQQQINGLFKTFIRQTTEDLRPNRPDLRSVFHDNAGVVDFDDRTVVCFKVETHNSPSALDPYGGAITGIVGVNRDILGTGKGAQPMFNTNVLCFADPAISPATVPEGLLHPRTVMAGVHRGIVDGGNQSGIPTTAGGFVFDESYLGKPLVFCGTGGLMPRTINGEASWIKHVRPGHLAVMLGGRIGKDGIHGATFSSLELDQDSPSSAVQIGDPITQRKVWDFLIEARNKGLYEGITDNGAGGLSSSLGEMAQASGGLRVQLELCPLKYQGLSPWEIWVSESQERMSLSVLPEKIAEFLALANRRAVEATVIGSFTDSGFIELSYRGAQVGYLDMAFLHDGLPPMILPARWVSSAKRRLPGADPELLDTALGSSSIAEVWMLLLAHPNVRSKESLVRQYDHEVQARTVQQGFRGDFGDAPTDGAVLRPVRGSVRGLSVTHGICPRVGDDDTYKMAVNAVDEAYRSHIALGGEPDSASALDNFCWPDPIASLENSDGAYKLAQLVRANQGLRNACLAYNLPLISGKDSMKNDARVGGKKISVRPTLLISLMGIVPDSRFITPSGFTQTGLEIWLLSPDVSQNPASGMFLGGSVLEHLVQNGHLASYGVVAADHFGQAPVANLEKTPAFYRLVSLAIRQGLIASIHDLSDGGLAVALAESSFLRRVGADIALPEIASARFLFAETPASFLCSIPPGGGARLAEIVGSANLLRLGSTIEEPVLRVRGTFAGSHRNVRLAISNALAAWKQEW